MPGYLPTAQEQLTFLDNFQRLLAEGDFTATYKFALLLALADLSVESAIDEGTGTLTLSIDAIAEKYIQYYWGQTAPFKTSTPGSPPTTLYQNTKGQAAVIRLLAKHQDGVSPKLGKAMAQTASWKRLIKKTAGIIVEHPLWRLQTVGTKNTLTFLYPSHELGTQATQITLYPGVAHHFRHFHGLITNMVQSAWIVQIHRIKNNASILGSGADLKEFLFGSERSNLEGYRPILTQLQARKCFYCGKDMKDKGEVDHFIPWSRYPLDLGHNFVLAHGSCNNSKRDFIADIPHLDNWLSRNTVRHKELREGLESIGANHDLHASLEITRWAYNQTVLSNGLFWRAKGEIVASSAAWAALFEQHYPT